MKKKLIYFFSAAAVAITGIYINIGLSIMLACILVCQWYFFNEYHNLVPNIFQDEQRNFRELKMGSERISEAERKADTLYCLAYKRSLQADICILERMYSFLSSSGSIHISYNLNTDDVEGIHPVDIYYLHSVTMNELGIRYQKFRYYFPFWTSPIYSIGYFLWRRKGICLGKCKSVQQNMERVAEYLEYISSFVDKRCLRLEIELKGRDEDLKKMEKVLSVECQEKILFKEEKGDQL